MSKKSNYTPSKPRIEVNQPLPDKEFQNLIYIRGKKTKLTSRAQDAVFVTKNEVLNALTELTENPRTNVEISSYSILNIEFNND